MQSSGPLKSPQPSPKRLNRRYAIFAVVGIIIVAAAASIPYFFPQSPDYTNQITTYYQGLGVSIVNPFERTTVFSSDAYVGSVELNKTLFNLTVFPRSSDSDAKSFQQTVVYQYGSQGFVEVDKIVEANGAVVWSGATNNSEAVSVSAIPGGYGPTGGPVVVVRQTPHVTLTRVAGTTTSSAQALKASPSAPAQQSPSRTINVTTARFSSVLRPESNADAWLLSAGVHALTMEYPGNSTYAPSQCVA